MRNVRVTALAIILILTGFVPLWSLPMPRAQQREKRHAIERMEESWRSAVQNHDTVALDALMSRDYMAITAEGTLLSREQTLENLRDGTLNYLAFEVYDRKIRFYGTTAVVTSHADVKRKTPEGEISGSYLDTRVYARDATGKWKIVHFEVNRIREPQEKK